jgi:hypothetical protein
VGTPPIALLAALSVPYVNLWGIMKLAVEFEKGQLYCTIFNTE